MVVEYQAASTNNQIGDNGIIEIKHEPQERDPRNIIISYLNIIQQIQAEQPEFLTTSQIPVSHEEVVSAQELFEQPQEELEDWPTILTRGRQQEKWGREFRRRYVPKKIC